MAAAAATDTVLVTHFDNTAYRQSAYCSHYVCCGSTNCPYGVPQNSANYCVTL